jgi:hypothetical protein
LRVKGIAVFGTRTVCCLPEPPTVHLFWDYDQEPFIPGRISSRNFEAMAAT